MENIDTQKHCLLCGGTGPFGKSASTSDGLYPLCKACINERQKRRNTTPKGKAITAWQSILKRAENRNGSNRTYATVKVQITRKEFMAWAVPAFTEWMKANPEQVPSVNRIDDNQGYILENLEVIEWGENSRRRPWNKNVHAPKGYAWCSRCGQYLECHLFRSAVEMANGLASSCRECERTYHREYARNYRKKNHEACKRYQREWKRKKAAHIKEQLVRASSISGLQAK